jgi:hypothetical protein
MRSGWKALLAGGATALLVAVALTGCGESKEPTKANTDSSLKPLPPPDKPGGTAPEAGKGKKAASNNASASGASVQ